MSALPQPASLARRPGRSRARTSRPPRRAARALLLAGAAALAASVAVLAGCKRGAPAARATSDAAPVPGMRGAEIDRPPAPPLVGGSAWLGTDRPLTLAELRGHVVVLDFWTYCCINCMHVIPELDKVERRFADQPVVVIGVHSGKFDAEKDPARIRAAMQRYGVNHPVVVDSEFAIWQAYGVQAWPTLAVIDPEGQVVAMSAGEPPADVLADLVGELLREGRRKGTLAERRIEIAAPPADDTGPLAFPGKVAVAPDGRIAIADSSHHRIVIVDGRGRRVDVAGSGMAGSADGPFEAAAFRRPQGVAWSDDGTRVYVADTENHQLRAVDLGARAVTTLAGTGHRGGRADGSDDAREVALRSPWDVAVDGERLYVAMAGAHQIWVYDLRTGGIAPLAGTGRESITDGAFEAAAFSQPSGLALAGRTLHVADSEVSAVRALDLDRRQVRTLVGVGLFDFGDRDGAGDAVRLQHALGVAVSRGAVYVADTYNNKVKRLDPATRQVVTVAGGDRAQLFEPGGIAALADGRLLIADTNNHRLRTLDPDTGALADFPLRGVDAPAAAGLILADGARGEAGPDAAVALPERRVAAEGQLRAGANALVLVLEAPAGGKLAEGAPVVVEGIAGDGIAFGDRVVRAQVSSAGPVELPIIVTRGARGPARVDVSYYWCTTGDAAACIPERVRLVIELPGLQEVAPGTASGAGRVTVRYRAGASRAPTPGGTAPAPPGK